MARTVARPADVGRSFDQPMFPSGTYSGGISVQIDTLNVLIASRFPPSPIHRLKKW